MALKRKVENFLSRPSKCYSVIFKGLKQIRLLMNGKLAHQIAFTDGRAGRQAEIRKLRRTRGIINKGKNAMYSHSGA